jgi:arabinofuranosyltransferase
LRLPRQLSTIHISALIAGAAGLISLLFLKRFAFDDLYISFRYAEHLASGQGLTWNVGQAPVEGYTNFLLVILLAVIHLIGLDPLISIQIVNILLTVATGILLAKLCLSFFEDDKTTVARSSAVLTTLAFIANPYVWQNALSGLETTLFTFLIVWSLHLLLVAQQGSGSYVPGFATATLATLARPDGVLFGMLAALVFVLASRNRSKAALGALIGFVLPVVLYELWRVWYFGSPLPNTFYVKVSNALNLFAGRSYVTSFYKIEVILVLMAMIGIWKLRRNAVLTTSALWIVGLSAFYVMPTPIQGFYFRFLFSVLTLLTLIAIPAVVGYAFKLKENYRWALLSVAIIAHLLINWRAARGEEIQAVIPEATAMYREMGEMLGSIPADSISFAYQDAGVVPYYSKQKHYDLVGLNDAFIGREKDPVRVIEYLEEEKPDVLLLPAERPGEGDTCWKIFRQGHGRMAVLGPSIVESDLLDGYVLAGRYLYIGYDILIYVRSGSAKEAIVEHLRSYPYRHLVLAGQVPCFR